MGSVILDQSKKYKSILDTPVEIVPSHHKSLKNQSVAELFICMKELHVQLDQKLNALENTTQTNDVIQLIMNLWKEYEIVYTILQEKMNQPLTKMSF